MSAAINKFMVKRGLNYHDAEKITSPYTDIFNLSNVSINPSV